MEERRTYTEEFKRDAVELSFNSDKTIKEIADDLGIIYGNLTRWRREYKDKGEHTFPGNGNQNLTPEEQKIKDLEDELRETKLERDILKKAVGIFSKKIEVIYGFIRDHSDEFPVMKMCHVLEVSRSGYYDWLNRKPSKRQLENEELKLEITKIYWKHSGHYGSPRIYRELRKKAINAILKESQD